jgi:hypothetical protein
MTGCLINAGRVQLGFGQEHWYRFPDFCLRNYIAKLQSGFRKLPQTCDTLVLLKRLFYMIELCCHVLL